MHHQGRKVLSHAFNIIWKQLMDSGSQSLRTKADHIFDARAYVTSKGSHRGEEVITFLVMAKNMLAFTHAAGNIPQIAMELVSVVIVSR